MLEAGSHWLSVGTQRLGETFLCSLAETVSRFLSGRGHHFPAPTCTLNSRVALGLACWWLSLFWLGAVWGFFFVAPTQRPVFFRRYPLDVLGLWLPAT